MSSIDTGLNLNIGSKVDEEFLKLLAGIPTPLKKIQGIAELDSFVLAENYFEAFNVADASIDPNGNMGSKSPVSFQSEIFKPQLKYRSYYEVWKEIKQQYGVDEANDCIRACIDGSLYFHDIVKLDMPYCFAFDTSFLMTEGRPYGFLPSKPPKRSNSFMAQVIETTMDLSQCHAGAIGIANVLVNLAYFTRKERTELHNKIQYIFDTMPQMPDEFDMTTNDMVRMSVMDAIQLFVSGLGLDEEILYDYMGCSPEGCGAEFTPERAFEIADVVYDKYVQNLIQNFVHIMHNTFRVGGDSPFTNISLFDHETFNTVFESALYPDMSRTVDNYEEVARVQKIYVEFFYKGSPTNGKLYRFPVTTANIKTKNGKIADEEFFEYMSKRNMERGAFNMHIGEKVATCCRLTSDLSKLKDEIRMDSFGNGGLSIGSHRVVAVNLHRIALYEKYAKPGEDVDYLQVYLGYAEKLLMAHKAILQRRVDSGFLNFFNIGWEQMEMFFSTIGYTGLIDSYSVKVGKSLKEVVNSPEDLDAYVDYASDLIDRMESFASVAGQRNLKSAFNVEEIPGENACPKLAQADNFLFKDFEGYEVIDLLSNQMIPLYCDVPLFTRLQVSGKLMNKVSGGSIIHININDTVTNGAYEELYRKIVEEYNVPHFAINQGSSTCEHGHVTTGIHEVCPECGAKCIDWTIRVVGFNTNWSDWSAARRAEFKKRQIYGKQDVVETARNILE